MKDKIIIWTPNPPELGVFSCDQDEPEDKIDKDKIDNIVFDGIDHDDFPDYCDAFICSADCNGRAMTEEELDALNDDRDFVYEKLMDYLY